jgi:hypothetical protein
MSVDAVADSSLDSYFDASTQTTPVTQVSPFWLTLGYIPIIGEFTQLIIKRACINEYESASDTAAKIQIFLTLFLLVCYSEAVWFMGGSILTC